MGWLQRLFGIKPATRGFEAGKFTRLTHSLRPATASMNADLRGGLETMRNRSRTLFQNNDYARRFGRMVQANIVGSNGFSLMVRALGNTGQPDKTDSDAVEAGFRKWSAAGVCDVSGRHSFAALCRILVETAARDGEFLVRKVLDKSAGNKFGFALQLLDPARIDTSYNVEAVNGNRIIMGVEVNTFRRPVAYHLLTTNPGDSAQRVRERVPADEVYHGFLASDAEQVRGVPWSHSTMLTLHNLSEFENSALLAARKGADTLGFFVSPNGEPPTPDAMGAEDEPIVVSVPGSYDTLPEGYDFKPYDSRYPDAILAAFSKYFLRRIASGWNVAYHNLANDLEGVNFSSIRSGTLDERDHWMALQAWFVDAFLTPVYLDWLRAALLKNALVTQFGSPLPSAKFDKYAAHGWQGRRWQWVDPLKDITASIDAINAGLASPMSIAAQQGVDVEDVLDDIARFQALARDKKIVLSTAAAAASEPPPPGEDADA